MCYKIFTNIFVNLFKYISNTTQIYLDKNLEKLKKFQIYLEAISYIDMWGHLLNYLNHKFRQTSAH